MRTGKSGRVLAALLTLAVLLAGCGEAEPPIPAPEEAPVAVETAGTTAPLETEQTEPPQTESPETEPAQPERFLLTFAGDCTFGSNPHNYFADVGFIKTVGEDYGYPFRNVLDFFENDEFTMVNLEGPLCDSGNPMQKKHAFHGPTAYTAILTENSVEAVTIANNHTQDYGPQGYASTLEALDNAGVPYVERDSSKMVETKNGLTIGLYGMVYYKLDVEKMVAAIGEMKAQGADLIIVAPHWGYEGTYHPTQEQMNVGHAAIDAGADIVFGSHPHVLQPIEEYGNGVIYYSMGNFSFGGNGDPGDYDTALLQQEVIRYPDGTVELGQLTRVPVCISSVKGRNNFQPTPMEPGSPEYDRVLGKLDGSFSGPNLQIH